MINISPQSEPSSVSVVTDNTASSGSACHALPSVQSQAAPALAGSSLHPDCLLRKHLIPMQELIYVL